MDKIKTENLEAELDSLSGINESSEENIEEGNNCEDELKKVKKELENFKEIALRKAAEVENIKRRSQEDLEKAANYSISKFAKELLPVMDALYLAIENAPKEELSKNDKCNNFFNGVNITFSELKKVFEKSNIVRLYPLNETFNHDLHQAIMQVESDKEEGSVVNVIQAGYTLNGRLIRPAMVAVSNGKKQ